MPPKHIRSSVSSTASRKRFSLVTPYARSINSSDRLWGNLFPPLAIPPREWSIAR